MGNVQSSRKEEGQIDVNLEVEEDKITLRNLREEERRSIERKIGDNWADQSSRDLKIEAKRIAGKRRTNLSTKNEGSAALRGKAKISNFVMIQKKRQQQQKIN